MDSVKRIGFVAVYAVSICMVFSTNAMLEKKTYGSSRSKRVNRFEDSAKPKEEGLVFSKIGYNADKENKQSKKRKAKSTPENSPVKRQNIVALAEIQNRVTSADGYQFQEMVVTPAIQQQEKRDLQRKQREESWTKKDNDDFFAKLYEADRRESEKKILQNRARIQQEQQAVLAKKIQEEKDKKYEEETAELVRRSTRVATWNQRDRQERIAERMNDTTVLAFKSAYAQNLYDKSREDFVHNRVRHDTAQNALHQLSISIAEEDYSSAGEVIKNNESKVEKGLSGSILLFPTVYALVEIGSTQRGSQEPQELHKILHSQKIGADFPEKNLDACAKYFAQQAGNEAYLKFAESLNK